MKDEIIKIIESITNKKTLKIIYIFLVGIKKGN